MEKYSTDRLRLLSKALKSQAYRLSVTMCCWPHLAGLGSPTIAHPPTHPLFQTVVAVPPLRLSLVTSWHPRSLAEAGSEFSVPASESFRNSTAFDTRKKPPETG